MYFLDMGCVLRTHLTPLVWLRHCIGGGDNKETVSRDIRKAARKP